MRRSLAVLAAIPLLAFAAPDEKLPPDLALVPPDALWFASVRGGDVAADARVRLALATLVKVAADPLKQAEDGLGVKLADLERVTAFQRRLTGLPPVILYGKKALDREALLKRFGKTREAEVHGRKVHTSADRPTDAIVFVGDRIALFGPTAAVIPTLASLAKGGKGHPLAEELGVAAGKHTLVAAARPSLISRTLDAEMPMFGGPEVPKAPAVEKSLPDVPDKAPEKIPEVRGFVHLVLDEKDAEGPKEAPLKLRTLKEITEGDVRADGSMWGYFVATYPPLCANRALITFDLGDTLKATMKADFDDVQDAEDSELLARYAMFAIRRQGPAFLRMGVFPRETAKTFDPVVKQVQEAVRAAVIKRDGKVLTGSISAKIDLRPLLKVVEVEMPAMDEKNKLQRIGLGFHAYHDTNNHFPRAICDKDGKALLSWRVAILPYIEEGALYKEFKLDEAWDSPHNKKLLAKMPNIYVGPPAKAADPDPVANTTPYQVFTGAGTMFPKPDSKTRFTSITDGTSNTFLVAEAAKAVPWTKPEDIDLDAKTFPKLGGRFEKFFHVVMCDGSVRKVKLKAEEKVLRVWIGPADGMIVNEKDLEP